ncbi:hypothetical protein HS088_TW04G00111 [Tripterygium wilfordii]|uniref:Heparanase-like protein 3 n=1 Tax=Tripterygium wilfordii TaxID=458696 RepID=A0A7J7DP82_TRIWF|nr:hypothetical protein HS088_TW04G00111 [Tripterygium wilfordii]
MASLSNLLHLIFWLYFVGHSSISVALQGLVSINGTAPIAETDNDFVCATIDWWPPEKCDYGTSVIFGLNALSGRKIGSDGSVIEAWNSSNAESLLRYTVNKGYPIYGWELGNELSGNGVGARISADQYAYDISQLQNLVQVIYKDFKVKPIVMAPGGFLDVNWYTEFLHKAPYSSLQAVSQHIYNLGPGVATDLVEKILNPSYLDGGLQMFSSLQNILKSSETSAVSWVSEAGGAWNSGHNHITNAFVFSFWYLDQLGMASKYDTKTYCRQSLIGGNYGLLNTNTFLPNPDYYSALLWHRLMGAKVLSTSFSGTNKIRAYAHCSKASQGITLLLINLDGNTTVHIQVSTGNAGSNGSLSMQEQNQTQRKKISRMASNNELLGIFRQEYHLTAKDGDLHSQTMLLNGVPLSVGSTAAIPDLEPEYNYQSNPIDVGPYSIVFAHMPNVTVPACK